MCDRHLILSPKVLDGSPTPDKAALISVFPQLTQDFVQFGLLLTAKLTTNRLLLKTRVKLSICKWSQFKIYSHFCLDYSELVSRYFY